MATIQKRGNSYLIRVSCGYDSKGKQVIQSMTWKPEPDMTPRQVEKELNRQAVMFEEKCLHINFTGSFPKISQAYQIIYKYSADHGIKLSDRAYEVFNKDMSVDVYYAIK